jgi:hypothetical protein
MIMAKGLNVKKVVSGFLTVKGSHKVTPEILSEFHLGFNHTTWG